MNLEGYAYSCLSFEKFAKKITFYHKYMCGVSFFDRRLVDLDANYKCIRG